MDKNSWIQQKRQFLSDYFSKRNSGNLKLKLQENSENIENNYKGKNHSWADLLSESRNLNSNIVLSSLDVHACGFKADDPKVQSILDGAFTKKVNEIFDYFDNEDLEVIKEKLLDYIIANRLYKRKLVEIVQKLKNLDPEELQNLA